MCGSELAEPVLTFEPGKAREERWGEGMVEQGQEEAALSFTATRGIERLVLEEKSFDS